MLAKEKAQATTTNEEVDLDELLDVSVFSFPFFSYLKSWFMTLIYYHTGS
jgi:hypothetical protein